MYFNSRQLSPLSNEAIFKKAPAVFAEQPKSTTSDNYLFVSTNRLIDGLRTQGWEVVTAKQTMNRSTSAENKETNKHALFLARQESLSRGANIGESLPLLKLENSHNGMSTFKLSAGFFRILCANGLSVPDSIYSAPKVRHTQDMRSEVIEATYKVLNDFPKLIGMREALRSINLTNEEIMLMGDTASELFFSKEERQKMQETAKRVHNDKYLLDVQLTRPVRHDDRKTDLWTVSNVIQENLIRGNVRLVRDNGRLVSQRAVTSIDRDNDIHAKLFAMTQKFAELKGVKIGLTA